MSGSDIILAQHMKYQDQGGKRHRALQAGAGGQTRSTRGQSTLTSSRPTSRERVREESNVWATVTWHKTSGVKVFGELGNRALSVRINSNRTRRRTKGSHKLNKQQKGESQLGIIIWWSEIGLCSIMVMIHGKSGNIHCSHMIMRHN